MHKKKQKECNKFGTHTCIDCQYQVLYCKKHAYAHAAKSDHKNIELLGLMYFKKQIKATINSIAKYTSDVIAEIRKTSLTTIINLRKVNKNVKSLNELTLQKYDAKRISFLVEQARDIDKKMDETPIETAEKLKNLLYKNEAEIASQQKDNEQLKNTIQVLADQMI